MKSTGDLKGGNTKSCGCLKDEITGARFRTHGMHGTQIYSCWLNMTYRSSTKCRMPTYADVGRVPEWDRFENFYADMGATYFPGAQLSRYGDVGDYGPTNCRWLTASENSKERNIKRVH